MRAYLDEIMILHTPDSRRRHLCLPFCPSYVYRTQRSRETNVPITPTTSCVEIKCAHWSERIVGLVKSEPDLASSLQSLLDNFDYMLLSRHGEHAAL